MSTVVTVDHTLKVPKESKEVVDLLAAIFDKIKAKAPIASYVDLVDELYVAAEGAAKIGDEVKSEHKGAVFAYLTEQIGNRL